MKIPSELELLGVQSREDADIILRDYPEWCTSEEKGTPERENRLNSQSNLELLFLGIFILITCILVVWILI